MSCSSIIHLLLLIEGKKTHENDEGPFLFCFVSSREKVPESLENHTVDVQRKVLIKPAP